MRTIGSALVLLLTLSPAFTQNRTPPASQETGANLEGFLTEGGVVNLVEGDVVYLSQDGPPQAVLPKQELKNGDAIETGQNGRAEILLNPGYYLRVSADTRIVFVDLAPNNLDLRITQGSAIVEISMLHLLYTPSWQSDPSYSDFYDPITVRFPHDQFSIVAGGLYRFDVRPERTQLRVLKGRAFFAGQRVGNGISAEFRNGSTTLAKINANEMDAFDLWSRGRAEFLITTNHSLRKSEWHKAIRENRLSYLNIEYDDDDERAREVHTVSALGGYVTFIQPGVFVASENAEWAALEPHTELKFGDRVKTDSLGRAHIHLYGTCSLFLASNTEVIYGVRPDGDAAVKVLRGSALIYFYYGEKEKAARPLISFATPQVEFEIIRDGIYQLTADNDSSEMNVYIGRVRVSAREIKEDRKVVARDAKLEIQNLSKRERDSLYVWSVKRMSALTRARRVKFNGMWYFDSEANTHTYVPGLRTFRSPYGGEYSVRFARERGRWAFAF